VPEPIILPTIFNDDNNVDAFQTTKLETLFLLNIVFDVACIFDIFNDDYWTGPIGPGLVDRAYLTAFRLVQAGGPAVHRALPPQVSPHSHRPRTPPRLVYAVGGAGAGAGAAWYSCSGGGSGRSPAREAVSRRRTCTEASPRESNAGDGGGGRAAAAGGGGGGGAAP
jgi:hypothetical protein